MDELACDRTLAELEEKLIAYIRRAAQRHPELHATTTRVTNSHEPARGVNTQRDDGRLKGEGDG